jgi:hypothetical protein
MTNFLNFDVFAAARGEGLHPELRLLFERAAASGFSDVAIRHDGMLQSGPDPASELYRSVCTCRSFRKPRPYRRRSRTRTLKCRVSPFGKIRHDAPSLMALGCRAASPA